MLEFSSDSSISFSGKHNFLMDCILGTQIINLLGVSLASLVVVIFYTYLDSKTTLRWITMLLIELNITAIDVFLRPVLVYFPKTRNLNRATLLARCMIFLCVWKQSLEWYFSTGILLTELLTWAKVWFFLQVVTKKPGVYRMILGYKSLSSQDSI